MRTFITILASFMSLSAYALTEAESADAKLVEAASAISKMDTLVAWFGEGSDLTFDDMSGVTVIGRCYWSSAPDVPYASVVSGISRAQDADNGPAFEGEKINKVILGHRPGATYYDNLASETTIAEAATLWDSYDVAFVKDGVLTSTVKGTTYDVLFRNYKDYGIAKTVNTADNSVVGACYYFKQVEVPATR